MFFNLYLDFNNFIPEIFLTLSLLCLLIYGVIYSTSLDNKYASLICQIIGNLSILSLILSLLLTLNLTHDSLSFLNGNFYYNENINFFQVIILLVSIFIVFISKNYIKLEKINNFEFYILLLLSILGMLLLLTANDFITLYLTLELQGLSLYILAGFKRDSAFSTEAALKYFILGALASGLFLFGAAMIYGFTGTTNFIVLSKLLIISEVSMNISYIGILIGMIFIISALLFKIAAAPFHMWSPDVYEGAPTTVTAFFATAPKFALLLTLTHLLMGPFYTFISTWENFIILCSIISMIVGTIGALKQKRIKRLLAYSSIGHVGYMLIALSTGTLEGINNLLLYMIIYLIMSIQMWTIVTSLYTYNTYNNNQSYKRNSYLTQLAYISKLYPLLGVSITLGLFSMAGIPPLAGFFPKMNIFYQAINNSLYLLAIIAIFTSAIAAFYYLRIIKIVFFEKIKLYTFYMPITREKSIIISITSFIIAFYVLSSPEIILSLKHFI